MHRTHAPFFEWHYLPNATCLTRPHLCHCVFRRVKDHHNFPNGSSLLKKTCVRQAMLGKWFPLMCCAAHRSQRLHRLRLHRPRARRPGRRRRRRASFVFVCVYYVLCVVCLLLVVCFAFCLGAAERRGRAVAVCAGRELRGGGTDRLVVEVVLFEISSSLKSYPSLVHAYNSNLRPVIVLFVRA